MVGGSLHFASNRQPRACLLRNNHNHNFYIFLKTKWHNKSVSGSSKVISYPLYCAMQTADTTLQSSRINIQITRILFNKLPKRLVMSNKRPKNTSSFPHFSRLNSSYESKNSIHMVPKLTAGTFYSPLHFQTRPRNTKSPPNRQEVLPDDQWRLGGANSQGCDTGSKDKFRWLEDGFGGLGQAIQ